MMVTSLLTALGLMATGKTASPSEVVVAVMVSEVPSGHMYCCSSCSASRLLPGYRPQSV